MKRLLDPQQVKVWIAVLLLAAAIVVIFHAVSQFDVFVTWIARFFWVISPFIWGFLLAYVLNIPREKMEHLLTRIGIDWVAKRKKGLSVLLIYITIFVVIWLLSIWVFPHIVATALELFGLIPSISLEIDAFIKSLSYDESFPFDFAEMIDDFNLADMFTSLNPNYMSTVIFDSTVAFLIFLFRFAISIISSVYFLVEGGKIRAATKRIFKALLPAKVYTPVVKYGRDINQYFKKYIYCQVLDAIILGAIMTVVLSLLQVEYALALGPLLGVANLIPYFGSIVGTAAAVIVIMVTDGTTLGIVAGVIMVIIQQIDANFIFPRLIGGQMRVSPLLVIIAITVGNAYFGIPGMIIAIPIITVVRNIIDDIIRNIEARKSKNQGGVNID